jgi:hypothetical protein
MSIPTEVRNEVRDQLWTEADRLAWPSLSAKDKARYYTIWTETPQWGGRLAAFMDARQVRVYIKDTLLKSYTRERMSDPARVLRIVGLAPDICLAKTYIKPHGRRAADGREVAWSGATEWKATLLALHERAYVEKGRPFAAVLFNASAKYPDDASRAVVVDAATKLKIEKLIWID